MWWEEANNIKRFVSIGPFPYARRAICEVILSFRGGFA